MADLAVDVTSVDLSVDIGTVRLAAPILPASGTFGFGHARVFDVTRLGALVPKTVMPEPRTGHPPPRLVETAGGLLNAIGIPSVGIEAFVADDLPRWTAFGAPVVVSLSADTAEGFAALCRRVDAAGGVAALELNLSCPNLEAGGRAFALDPGPSAAVVAACRAASALPLWAKLSPAAGAPAEVAKAAVGAGADALILGNTLIGLALRDGRPALANRTGGLSGAPLKPVALRIVDEVCRTVPAPVIGCGGVSSLGDVLDYFAAGASAVAVGTATLARPSAMVHLIDALAAHCDAHGLAARDLRRRA
jgi:dihydroorotate dehydrogenase (NAD+) catalytic subunit